MFGHEKFGAYHTAIEFVALATQVIERIPPGYSKLSDQLKRASISVPLNIAEGSGKATQLQKRQYYSIARGEAMECAAIMDVLRCLGIIDEQLVLRAKQLLEKVVAILSSVCRKRDTTRD